MRGERLPLSSFKTETSWHCIGRQGIHTMSDIRDMLPRKRGAPPPTEGPGAEFITHKAAFPYCICPLVVPLGALGGVSAGSVSRLGDLS